LGKIIGLKNHRAAHACLPQHAAQLELVGSVACTTLTAEGVARILVGRREKRIKDAVVATLARHIGECITAIEASTTNDASKRQRPCALDRAEEDDSTLSE